jgi:hypothetical protein
MKILKFWKKGTPPPYLPDRLNQKRVVKRSDGTTSTYTSEDDDGTIVDNVKDLSNAVVGHCIVKAERGKVPQNYRTYMVDGFIITLDNGTQVFLKDTHDCCAFTELQDFLLHPESVNHVIMGIATEDQYTTWHIYADYGDILNLQVSWSCGNPFYYGYGFDIQVQEI